MFFLNSVFPTKFKKKRIIKTVIVMIGSLLDLSDYV